MAGELNIKPGTKMQIAYDVPLSEQPDFNMASSFGKGLDESAFLISVPMRGGKAVEFDESKKLLIKYSNGSESEIVAGYADDVVKQGIRSYWKIRRVTEHRQFFQRADERIKVSLKTEYLQDTWPVNIDGIIEKEDALTLDISAGGAALFVNRRFEVGEIIQMFLPRLGTGEEGAAKGDIVSVVCWQREAPKGGAYRFVCGVQFRFAGPEEKEDLRRYVAFVKKRYKL
ncbi:MAG: PilZ domain-containing protein [Clostridiales bacterium]|nr:PilZ domain-containing protein [Clostridiales bacterium]